MSFQTLENVQWILENVQWMIVPIPLSYKSYPIYMMIWKQHSNSVAFD